MNPRYLPTTLSSSWTLRRNGGLPRILEVPEDITTLILIATIMISQVEPHEKAPTYMARSLDHSQRGQFDTRAATAPKDAHDA